MRENKASPRVGPACFLFFLFVRPANPEGADGLPWRERGGETAFLAEGDLFQEDGCPYVLSRRQAEEVMNDDSELGNTITLVTHGGGERVVPKLVFFFVGLHKLARKTCTYFVYAKAQDRRSIPALLCHIYIFVPGRR